ncbi:uncharacterized protein F5Z01DRAFT_663886 [Emericellopsis atlantica]|uniref:Uncharacterized protein n=1 Tax=Emericellopsis atlantica TaxID=2614577 RepID=A0A9P8CLS2_9HYPO|nr:uncharacterized protein F5Z01DRAFT_663886 [Emericellopsis atlantica]KAG9251310.1 hypothetical protein F5Z01DRAFT_663886 [Emericellopsis atlantica]
MELPFITLDVFTTEPYKGNPLAIVTIPASQSPAPTQEQKQLIAREFNLSETVFVHESAGSSRNIDIFITDTEIPFAGHPTVGTAVSLLSQGVNELVTKAGPIAIDSPKQGYVKAGIPFNTHQHANTLGSLQDQIPSTSLHKHAAIRNAELAAPLYSIVKGMTFALVELPDLETLAAVVEIPGRFSPEIVLDQDWKEGIIGQFYYVKQGGDEDTVHLRTRMIMSFEDPATGSASCALACYLAGRSGATNKTITYEMTQGVEMGRQSDIIVEVVVKDGQVDRVSLAGTATQVMRGYVTV